MGKLIGLHGLPRAGKDSIALRLSLDYDFMKLSFADPLKEAAAVLLGRPIGHARGEWYDREAPMQEWGFSMRWFLQRLGTECLRDQICEDFWIKRAAVSLAPHAAVGQNVVFTDVRFPNEADFIRSRGGIMVEVTRPGTKASGHASDQPLRCEYRIHNGGTYAELDANVHLLVDHLNRGI